MLLIFAMYLTAGLTAMATAAGAIGLRDDQIAGHKQAWRVIVVAEALLIVLAAVIAHSALNDAAANNRRLSAEAVATAGERFKAERERDLARSERDKANQERNKAQAERDEAQPARRDTGEALAAIISGPIRRISRWLLSGRRSGGCRCRRPCRRR